MELPSPLVKCLSFLKVASLIVRIFIVYSHERLFERKTYCVQWDLLNAMVCKGLQPISPFTPAKSTHRFVEIINTEKNCGYLILCMHTF